MAILLQASSQGRRGMDRPSSSSSSLSSSNNRRRAGRMIRNTLTSAWLQLEGQSVSWTTAVTVTLVSNLLVYQLCQWLWLGASPSVELGVLTTTPTASAAAAASETTNGALLDDDALGLLPPVGRRLAFEQSYGFFDDIPDEEWIAFYQTPARRARHYRSDPAVTPGANPNHHAKFPARWNFFNWDPYFNCPHLQKVGGLGGGPKWTCDVERIRRVVERRQKQRAKRQDGGGEDKKNNKNSHCLVYSIGSRGNYRWELGLVDMLGGPSTCEIHVFDYTNFAQPNYAEQYNIHFHEWGLGSSYSPDYRRRAVERGHPTFVSFFEIRRRLGHENRTIDLFKIDCEICEWHSYKDWITADLRQVLVETHELPVGYKKIRSDFGVLPAMNVSNFFDAFSDHGFVLYSKEVNTQRGYGRSVEWSFLKLRPDFLKPKEEQEEEGGTLGEMKKHVH